MSAVGPALQGVGTAVGVVGALQHGKAAKASSKYEAQLALTNASLARQEAEAEEYQLRRNASKVIGQMQANYAASGVSLTGSPLDVLADSAAAAELDALTARARGENLARNYELQAALTGRSGRNIARESGLLAASKLIQGGYETYSGMESLGWFES